MSLIKKASYLTDKGQVTFGRDFKRFPSVRFEARETKCVFFAGISGKWCRRERIGREITAGRVQIRAAWVSAGGTGTNCAVSGCLFNTTRADVDL